MQPQRSRSRRHKSGQPYLQGSKTHVTAMCVSFCQPERPTRCAPPELQEHRLALSPPDTRAFQSRMAHRQRTSGRRHAPVKSEAVLLPAVAGKKIPPAAARPFARLFSALVLTSALSAAGPVGEIAEHRFDRSQVFPGTTHCYWTYVPRHYDPAQPAGVFVWQDRIAFDAPAVFDRHAPALLAPPSRSGRQLPPATMTLRFRPC